MGSGRDDELVSQRTFAEGRVARVRGYLPHPNG